MNNWHILNTKKYKTNPNDEFLLMTAYDSGNVIINALSESKDSDKIINFINNYNQKGALGDISFDKNGDIKGVNFSIYKMLNNTSEKLIN